MLILLSPAKTLDLETPAKLDQHSQPTLLDDSEALVNQLSTYSPDGLEKLMNLSSALAELNVERYHNWSRPFTKKNAKQAIYTFKGDVYVGLESEKLTPSQMRYAQDHLRILSGLYGVLRPLDLMQAYRLEMGTKLSNERGKNLYEFWGEKITDNINKQLQAIDSKYLINLASNEYFRSIKTKSIQAQLITPEFKDYKNGQYKVISFFAKKARGAMAAWLIKQRVKSLPKLKKFSWENYAYNDELSSDDKPVFTRKI